MAIQKIKKEKGYSIYHGFFLSQITSVVIANMTTLIRNGIASKSSEQLKCSREEKEVGIRTEDGIQP